MGPDVLSFKYALKEPKDPEAVRVTVAMPTHDQVPAVFMFSVLSMGTYSVSQLTADSEFGQHMVKGTYVHSARQQILESLLQRDLTHILWLDTDMKFPRDSLMRLLAHDEDVVGINYSHRGPPYEFVAIKKVGWENPADRQKCMTLRHSKGLERVEALGFGMALMKVKPLREVLPDPKVTPWFWFDWVEGLGQVGEDVRFCKMLTDAGINLYVDHDLSKECSHVGEYEYDCEGAAALSNPATVKTLAAL